MVNLKERYAIHELPRCIKEKMVDDKVLVLNMEDNCLEFKKLQAKNKRQIVLNKLLQKIHPSFNDYLKVDGIFLKEIDELYTNTINMINTLYPLVDSDNYMEIARLVDFILVLYSDNYNVIGFKRRSLKFNKRGIEYFDNRFEDTRGEIDEFFSEESKKFIKEKNLEKIKKI